VISKYYKIDFVKKNMIVENPHELHYALFLS